MTKAGATSGRGDFFRTITEAVAYFTAHGYESAEALEYWMGRIRHAAAATLTPEYVIDQEVRRVLAGVYQREVDGGAILKRHPGVSRFTFERAKPHLRAELDRRILANAALIKLNRERAVEDTVQRLAGWATSIPLGGSDVVDRADTKQDIRQSLAGLPFRERRVAIDQGHKFVSSLNDILAKDAGALAMIWHSHWRQRGYNYREDHKERDGQVYLIRGNWAYEKGLIKVGSAGYSDQITAPAEEVFCRCYGQYLYTLRSLPDEMLTEKGRATLNAVRVA